MTVLTAPRCLQNNNDNNHIILYNKVTQEVYIMFVATGVQQNFFKPGVCPQVTAGQRGLLYSMDWTHGLDSWTELETAFKQ